jgi:hypothetical protein
MPKISKLERQIKSPIPLAKEKNQTIAALKLSCSPKQFKKMWMIK